MNYVRNKLGQCEPLKDLIAKNQEKTNSEKEEDCALEGFFSVTQGYRKIPGNMCYGGVQMDPIRKPCTKMVWLSSLFKGSSVLVLLAAALACYYGWPVIEAIIIFLPIPDPQNVKEYAGQALGFVAAVFSTGSSDRRAALAARSAQGYETNLQSAAGGNFDEDEDDSDEDVGKPMALSTALESDSDEALDEEAGPAPHSSELIDL